MTQEVQEAINDYAAQLDLSEPCGLAWGGHNAIVLMQHVPSLVGDINGFILFEVDDHNIAEAERMFRAYDRERYLTMVRYGEWMIVSLEAEVEEDGVVVIIVFFGTGESAELFRIRVCGFSTKEVV